MYVHVILELNRGIHAWAVLGSRYFSKQELGKKNDPL